MSPHRITRRDVFRAGAAAAALPLVSASAALAGEKAPPPAALTLGMATTGFHDYTNAQLAEELAGQGLHMVQLFFNQKDSRYWKYNGRSDLAGLSAPRCEKIGEAYRSAGVSIHSLGVYTNLSHPDPAERDANLAYFEAMIKAGGAMGVRTFITEAGHYHSDQPAPPVAYHFQEKVWYQMVATGKRLAELAETHQATVLLEPSFAGFLASAKRTRLFIEEVGSPRIRALLDPANLLEINDLGEMFDQLEPWIDCFHAKDRKLHAEGGVAAGKGDIDYPTFVTLAARRRPRAPLILEYVGADNYKQALAHLRAAMRKVGVREG